MARKSNYISILQFDSHLITLLRVERSAKGIYVVDFEVARGAWQHDDGSLGDALKEFVKRHNVADDTVYTVLPRHDVTARIQLLPSTDIEEIRGMVRFSAEEYMPYPLQELVIDQCILDKLPDHQSRVLCVFVHRDVVQMHVDLLGSAGIEPASIFLSSTCMASAAIAAHSGDHEPIGVVNLASGGIEVMVLRGTKLEYVRGVVTALDWDPASPDAASAGEELAIETRAALSTYRRESEDGAGVETVYLCSDYADATAWCEPLEQQVGYSVHPADYAQALITSGAEKLTALPLVALGAALAAQDRARVAISLVPESLSLARHRVEKRRSLTQMALATCVLLAALLGLYLQAVWQRKAYVNELEERIHALAADAKSVAEKQRLLLTLEEQVDKSGTFVELLGRMTNLAPHGINILRIEYTHGDIISVEGTALSDLLVNQWAEALRAAGKLDMPQFAQARSVKTTRAEKVFNTEIVGFKMDIPFPKEATSADVQAGAAQTAEAPTPEAAP